MDDVEQEEDTLVDQWRSLRSTARTGGVSLRYIFIKVASDEFRDQIPSNLLS
jgi:hypothetical protein